MQIVSIQYLRGISALMVVLHHLLLQLQRIGYSGYWPTFLPAGVDMFFVISGFIMWVTTFEGVSPGEFFRRRIIRIVPLYWLLTSTVLVVLLAYPGVVQAGRFDALHVIASYLFIPYVHPVEGGLQPLLIPGWTLNYEMFFYLLFGITLLLDWRRRFRAIVALLAGLAIVPLLVSVPAHSAIAFYTSDIVLEFAFGVLLGRLYTERIAFPPALAWTCLVLGGIAIIACDPSTEYRGLLVGIPAFVLTTGAVMLERIRPAPDLASLHLLGNMSYSLYLSHTIVLSAASQAWRKLPVATIAQSTLAFGIATLAIALAGGYLVYVLAERPLLRSIGHRAREPSRA